MQVEFTYYSKVPALDLLFEGTYFGRMCSHLFWVRCSRIRLLFEDDNLIAFNIELFYFEYSIIKKYLEVTYSTNWKEDPRILDKSTYRNYFFPYQRRDITKVFALNFFARFYQQNLMRPL